MQKEDEEGARAVEDKKPIKDIDTAVGAVLRCPASCMLCKKDGHFEVTTIPGLAVYEVKPCDGWHMVAETARHPLAVFILCPGCKQHAGVTTP